MRTLEMKDYGLTPLSDQEIAVIDGGLWWQVVGAWVIASWDDLKQGWKDGYTERP